MGEMKSSLAEATMLDSLNATTTVSICRLEQRLEIQAEALSRLPSLMSSLGDAAVCRLS